MGRLLYSLRSETPAAPQSTPVTSSDNVATSNFSSPVQSPPRSPSPSFTASPSDLMINQRPYTRETTEFMEEFLSGRPRALPEDYPYSERATHPPVGGVPMRRVINTRPQVPELLTRYAFRDGRHYLDHLNDYGQVQRREMEPSIRGQFARMMN